MKKCILTMLETKNTSVDEMQNYFRKLILEK